MSVANTPSLSSGVTEDLAPRGAVVVRALLRVTVLVSAGLLLAQPVLAGLGLEGNTAATRLHATVGVTFLAVALAQDLLAILSWKPMGGAGWVPIVAVSSHLLGLVQMELGHGRAMAFHLPVGITLLALAALLVIGAWTSRGRRRADGAPILDA